MTSPDPSTPISPFSSADLALLQSVAAGSGWARAVACTLARRGVAFRLKQPDRAAAFLQALERLPFYKAGQFLFDLLEWEDFMLDGPPPPILPGALDARSLERLASALRSVQQAIDNPPAPPPADASPASGGAASPETGALGAMVQNMFQSLVQTALQANLQAGLGAGEPLSDADLPPLQSGFDLYQDVVLGIIVSALRPQSSFAGPDDNKTSPRQP